MSAAVNRESAMDRLAFARGVLLTESESLRVVAGRLGESFERMVDAILHCRGRIAVTGVGKSADIGQKIVGTLNSTGTRAYLLDATRAVHGDLGMLHPDDLVLMLSHSGESDELIRLIEPLRGLTAGILAMTSNSNSSLAKRADLAVVYGHVHEACPLALAPSTSTTVTLALGDALALTLLEIRQFTSEQFARFHPAGSLGRKLASVDSVMRRGSDLRIASESETVRSVFAKAKHTGRRTGAVMLVDHEGKLTGLFTDSDLARLFENHIDRAFDQSIGNVMTKKPITIRQTAKVYEAIELLKARKISELPVVDELGQPIGMIDITDLIGLEPESVEPDTPTVLKLIGAKS